MGNLLELEAEAIAELGLSDRCLNVALDEIVDRLSHAGAHAHAIEEAGRRRRADIVVAQHESRTGASSPASRLTKSHLVTGDGNEFRRHYALN